jgi:hypothetical protein
LRVGLHAAGHLDRPYPPTGEPRTPAEQGMRRAADGVGAIGAILASHMHPGRAPRTPKGRRSGPAAACPRHWPTSRGSPRSLLAVEAKLPAWLGRAEAAGVDRFGQVPRRRGGRPKTGCGLSRTR